MNRLSVRLILAFALVIAVTLGVVGVLAGARTGEALRIYLSYLGAPTSAQDQESLLTGLATYYRTYGSWEGIEDHLEPVHTIPGRGMGMRRGITFPLGTRAQVVLADANGRVVYDELQGQVGRSLTSEEHAAALLIQDDGTLVGRIVLTLPMQSAILGPLEHSFLHRLQQALLTSAIVAAVLGALIGVGLSRSLSSPLQALASAARGLAGRDLSRRVQVQGTAEVVEVAQAFNEMAQALQQGDELRRNLMADVAHELRTPLTVLQGNLQAILDGVYTLSEDEVARLYSQTKLLSRLVDDLRELALAEAGKLNMTMRPVDLAALLSGIGQQMSAVAEGQDTALRVELPTALPLVRADPDRVSEVLHNLIANALRHTPAGGSVTIRARSSDGEVTVSVEDTGSGIGPEDLAHVFDRFWHADKQAVRQAWDGGSGLGLAIAQGLIQAHGGRIWAESEVGSGSTFRFTLPVASGDVA